MSGRREISGFLRNKRPQQSYKLRCLDDLQKGPPEKKAKRPKEKKLFLHSIYENVNRRDLIKSRQSRGA